MSLGSETYDAVVAARCIAGRLPASPDREALLALLEKAEHGVDVLETERNAIGQVMRRFQGELAMVVDGEELSGVA